MNLVSLEGFNKVVEKYGYMFSDGIVYTLSLSLGAVLFGILIALIIVPLRMSKLKPCRYISILYIEVIRSTPLYVQLMVIYFGIAPIFEPFLPDAELFGIINLKRYIPSIIALGVNSGAYVSEIIRGGINGVDRGQTEAGRSLGLTASQTTFSIVLPQAIRNILPSLANEFITIIKETSVIGAALGVHDIMYQANSIQSKTYLIMEPLLVAAGIYFILIFPASKIIAYIERRMNRGYQR